MIKPERIALKRVIAVAGFMVFMVALATALHQAAPRIEQIEPVWLPLMCVTILANLVIQMEQIIVFLRSQGIEGSRYWATWFASEKAWLNVAIPAKAGTVGAVAIMAKRHDLSWSRYVAFMLLCSAFTVIVSLGGALFLFLEPLLAMAACTTLGLALIMTPWLPGKQRMTARILLLLLAIANLLAISLGMMFALRSLGIEGGFGELLPAGIALNLLSLASITPGNFGVREVVLAALSPVLTVSFSHLILAATTLVTGRLALAFALATVIRRAAWTSAK